MLVTSVTGDVIKDSNYSKKVYESWALTVVSVAWGKMLETRIIAAVLFIPHVETAGRAEI